MLRGEIEVRLQSEVAADDMPDGIGHIKRVGIVEAECAVADLEIVRAASPGPETDFRVGIEDGRVGKVLVVCASLP